jgi:hypothetical protein
METQHELIKKVVAIQAEEDMSDRAFADKLGISNGKWSGVKAGRLHLGRKSLRAILAEYPTLKKDVDSYWLWRLNAGASEVLEVQAS